MSQQDLALNRHMLNIRIIAFPIDRRHRRCQQGRAAPVDRRTAVIIDQSRSRADKEHDGKNRQPPRPVPGLVALSAGIQASCNALIDHLPNNRLTAALWLIYGYTVS